MKVILAYGIFISTVGWAQESVRPVLVQPALTAPGSPPFHMQAIITDKDDPDSRTEIEMYWVAPDKWRRTIKGDVFSQTLIVNGEQVQDNHEDGYLPLTLETLLIAMTDPRPILDSVRPGDQVHTKANGDSQENGLTCFGDKGRMCGRGQYGLIEMVSAPGHPVEFTRYESFGDVRVARLVTTSPEIGSKITAAVTKLEPLTNPSPQLFQVSQPTPPDSRIRTAVLADSEMRSLRIGNSEIIWPQVLDGPVKGTASLYVSVDPAGKVRETVPLFGGNERAMDSLRRQIMGWSFKPAVKAGGPVQAESIMKFDFDTRAFGPPEPLSDADARKLATNQIEPDVAKERFPEGATCTLHVAIDHEGQLIEMIQGPGPLELCSESYRALQQWRFSPLMENGQPRPYRADLVFRPK